MSPPHSTVKNLEQQQVSQHHTLLRILSLTSGFKDPVSKKPVSEGHSGEPVGLCMCLRAMHLLQEWMLFKERFL